MIHLAFDHSAFGHDFSKFAEVCEKDKRAIEVLGSALIGSDTPAPHHFQEPEWATRAPGQPATEGSFRCQPPKSSLKAPEVARASVAGPPRSEQSSVRAPSPGPRHGGKQGLITYAVQVAREKGVSAYRIGEGRNCTLPAALRSGRCPSLQARVGEARRSRK